MSDYRRDRRDPHRPTIFSIPALTSALANPSPERETIRRTLLGLKSKDTAILRSMTGTATKPLVAWGCHLVLSERGVPPCLRSLSAQQSEQFEYIDWLADIEWVTRQYPHHVPPNRNWAPVFRKAARPLNDKWYELVFHRFDPDLFAHGYVRRLGLSLEQQHDLNVIVTGPVKRYRYKLLGRADEVREWLLDDAMRFPDRAKKFSPSELASMRFEVCRSFVLAGGSPTKALGYLKHLTGREITRGALAKHREKINRAIHPLHM